MFKKNKGVAFKIEQARQNERVSTNQNGGWS